MIRTTGMLNRWTQVPLLNLGLEAQAARQAMRNMFVKLPRTSPAPLPQPASLSQRNKKIQNGTLRGNMNLVDQLVSC